MTASHRSWRSLLKWDSPSGCPPKVTARFLVMSLAIIAVAQPAPLACALPTQQKSAAGSKNKPARDLHKLGEAIAKAVLDKNIATLLTYDRADLRSQDEVSLKNNKSDLYCYIFDSDCITWGDGTWRSVYDKLSQAQPLEIKVSLTRSPSDRQLYGSLFFYDAASISDKDLRSSDFFCKQVPTKIASWRFRLENGKWRAVTPLFDSETLGACPSPPQPAEDEDKEQPPPQSVKP